MLARGGHLSFFGRPPLQLLVTALNLCSGPFNVFFFSQFRHFFMLRHRSGSDRGSSFDALHQVKSAGQLSACVVFAASYHRNLLGEMRRTGLRSVGLTSPLVEPWALWYPIFCNGDSLLLQQAAGLYMLWLIAGAGC